MSNPFDQFGSAPTGPTETMNPYGAQPPMQQPPPMQGYGAPPPQTAYGAPPQMAPMYGGAIEQQPMPQQPMSQPPPAMNGQNPYGAPPPEQAMVPTVSAPAPPNMMAPAPAGNPFGGYEAAPPAQPPALGAPPVAGMLAPAAPISTNAMTVSDAPSNPYAGYGQPPAPALPPAAPPSENPFESYGAPPAALPPAPMPQQSAPVPPQQGYADPWGAPAPTGMPGMPPADAGAIVPAAPAPPPADPFAVFSAAPAPPVASSVALSSVAGSAVTPYGGDSFMQQQQMPPQQPAAAPPASNADDIFAEMGFDAPAPDIDVKPTEPGSRPSTGDGNLPPGGEWYDAKIFTPTLGVMFFKPKELTDSLFLNTEGEMVESLDERPVVAFIVEGSSARSAGVELGHVLLKVNGIDVKNPKEASRLIKEGPRPLPLLFYVPPTDVVTAEGEHMVKYDTRETTAPNSAKDWKPKYVVIGGIIAQPWMMNMYRSKSEYDIAVIETQARRPVSVKVKQFSLQGARVQNDWQGPQMVKYKNKLHPWKYIVILPVARNPIKISSPNLSQLKPVHEGIRRVLLAQQRDRGHNAHTAAPVRQSGGGDPYAQNGRGGGGDSYGRGGGGGGGGDPYGRGGGGDPYGQAPPPRDPYAQGGGGGAPQYAHGGENPYGGSGYGQPQQQQPAYRY